MERALPVKGFKVALAALGLLLAAACAGAPAAVEQAADPGTAVTVGYLVADASTGEVLAAQNADQSFPPASTAKVATMVSALELLGPDYRFVTRVRALGRPGPDGALVGDLVLEGGGDPLLVPQDLLGLAQRLYDLGLRKVTGRFLYDESLLPSGPAINPDQPAEAQYNPGFGALALDFNRWRLRWQGDVVDRLPPLPVHRVVRSDAPAGPGREVTWQSDAWRIAADAPASGDQFLPVRAPGLATAETFRQIADQVGIVLPAPQAGKAAPATPVVTELVGRPLAEVARLGLEHSNNLVSELVGMTAARALGVRPRDLETSATALSQWLTKAAGNGTDWSGWDLKNHSGLSRHSRVTPRQMASVLRFAQDRRYDGWPFASLLPAAGHRRAFRDRYRDEAAALRVWAKTGTLHYAKGLTGYLQSLSGRRLLFAIYIADSDARARYDALSPAARDHPDEQRRAGDWIDRAETEEQNLVTRWLKAF